MEFLNRVKFATSTPGTSDIAVGARESSFLTPALAGASNGEQYSYFIVDGDNFAHGVGTYSTSGPTLQRDSNEISWNGSSYSAGKLSLSGSAVVHLAKQAEDLRRIVLPPPPGAEISISSGAITVVGSNCVVDTEGNAASDNLDNILGGYDGMIVSVKARSSSRTVVVRDGVGNLRLSGSDMSLDNVYDRIMLERTDTDGAGFQKWVEISRSNNGA
ncbi:MAG: hypothetical protein KDA43_15165 [Hyphomonas sp.]|nr:hypothetical protein [Hyphomonas sp.]